MNEKGFIEELRGLIEGLITLIGLIVSLGWLGDVAAG